MNGTQNGKCNHFQNKTIQDTTGYKLDIQLSLRSIVCEDDQSPTYGHLTSLQDVTYLRTIIIPGEYGNYIVRYGDTIDMYPNIPQCTPEIIQESYAQYIMPEGGIIWEELGNHSQPSFTEELAHSPSILGTLFFVVIVLFG